MTSTPLHAMGDALRALLLSIPLPAVRVLFLVILAGVLVWVLLLPRAATTAPGGPVRGGANLKVGAAIAIVLQLAIYALF
ncbi:MAG: hypothetical protein AB7U20_02360 [Planctomycetaceae bacterium]